MSVAFSVNNKSGDYIKATVVSASHSAESRFGPMDGAIIAFFLLCVGGLIYLLVS